MNRKKYQKPRFISHYINAKSVILAGSPGTEITEGDEADGFGAKRAYGRFAWDEDED